MTNAHAPSCVLTSLVVACVAATARAQSSFEWETSVAWPSSLGSPGSIGRVVAGDVDGDLRPDVFARGAASPGTPDGTHDVLFLSAPWLGNGLMKLGIRAIDVDFQAGRPGNLAFVKNSGLWLLSWAPSSSPPFAETQVASGAPWAGAKKVRCANLDSSAGDDYAGVAPDGHTLVLRRTNTGGTTTVLVDVTDQVVDLFALQWVQGGSDEIAVLTTDDLFFYDGTGSLLDSFAAPVAGPGVIARVRFGTNGPDRVAWVSRDSSGDTTRFDLVRRASPQLEGPVTPEFSDVVAMAAADVDHDGDEDLVMTHAADRQAWIYKSGFVNGTSRVYSANRSHAVDDEHLDPEDVLTNGSTFVFADLGNDLAPDLLLPVESAEGTSFEILSSIDRIKATSAEVFENIASQAFVLDEASSPMLVAFQFKSLDFDEAGDMTHVQVIVWDQVDATTDLTPAADLPAQYFEIEPGQFVSPDPVWGAYDVALHLGTNETGCSMPVRWIEVRLVQWEDDELIDSGPTYTCAITTRIADFCAIDNAQIQEIPLVTNLTCQGATSCSPEPDSGSFAGQAIPRTRKPGPPSGNVTSVGLGSATNAPPIPVN